jgi:arginyl-tRNA synthetase
MVELPEGKMKSREGKVVDADHLMEEMIRLADETSKELGKSDGFTQQEISEINRITGMGALKYFILKIDPKKNMIFNPAESIDFNGNTGVFIQYTYARIQSLLTKASESGIELIKNYIDPEISPDQKEIQLIKIIYNFKDVIEEAASSYNPALIANYSYELAKEYNQFYHEYPVIKAENSGISIFRLLLSEKIAGIIKFSLKLLGIETPERM